MRNQNQFVIGLLSGVIVTWVTIFYVGYHVGLLKTQKEPLKERIDTLYQIRVDTLKIPVSEPKTTTPETVEVGDTTVQREKRVYKGEGFTAVVSGIDPTLDSLSVENRITTVIKEVSVAVPSGLLYRPQLPEKDYKHWQMNITTDALIGRNSLFLAGLEVNYKFTKRLQVGAGIAYDIGNNSAMGRMTIKYNLFEW